MSYIKRADLIPDTRAIADLGGGVESRITRVIETTGEGVLVELPNGEQAMARRVVKPEMIGMIVELGDGGGPGDPEAAAGELVQVEYLVKPDSERMTPIIHVLATWIDSQGNSLAGVDHRTVIVEFKHNASQYQQDEIGLQAMVRECLMLVLGEPLTPLDVTAPDADPEAPPDIVTLIPWDPEQVRAVDIRRAIKIAKESTEVDLDLVL